MTKIIMSNLEKNRVEDGFSCSGCGLPNYHGLCPYCRGDSQEYEEVLVPPFESSLQSTNEESEEDLEN